MKMWGMAHRGIKSEIGKSESGAGELITRARRKEEGYTLFGGLLSSVY